MALVKVQFRDFSGEILVLVPSDGDLKFLIGGDLLYKNAMCQEKETQFQQKVGT